MKLPSIHLDDNVCIEFAKDNGSGQPRTHVRDSAFHVADGWHIERIEKGVYTLWREGMPEPMALEGYGASFPAGSLVGESVGVPAPENAGSNPALPATLESVKRRRK